MQKIVVLVIAALAIASAPSAGAGASFEDPHQFWLLRKSDDGASSIYLAKTPFSPDKDTGTTTVYIVRTDINNANYEYAIWIEDQFNCSNHTFGTRYYATFDPEGVRKDVVNGAQADITFSPVTPGQSLDIAYGIACGLADPSALSLSDLKTVPDLIKDQYATYAKVYAATHRK